MSLLDLGYRVALRSAYRAARVYWRIAHPQTHGALVAAWHHGEILLVRNSYAAYHSLPGGYVHDYEDGLQAARRELKEELGLVVGPDALALVVDLQHEWEGKREHVEIFELELPARPELEIDNREVIAAGFYPPERALEMPLFPPIKLAIEQRLSRLARAPGAAGGARR